MAVIKPLSPAELFQRCVKEAAEGDSLLRLIEPANPALGEPVGELLGEPIISVTPPI